MLVEDRLKPESIEADGLIAIDAAVLGKALPASLAHPAPGTPPLKAVAAYYAPEGKFKLSAKFIKPPVEMAVSTSLLWRVSDRGYEVLGGFTLLPRGEKLFSFDFTTPPDWTITAVTAAEEKPLKFDRFGAADKAGRIRVYVPQGMAADQEFKVNFQAVHTPKGWLADWKSDEAATFPSFAVAGAIRDEGAIAVEVRDDITVRPETLESAHSAGRHRESRLRSGRRGREFGLSLRKSAVCGGGGLRADRAAALRADIFLPANQSRGLERALRGDLQHRRSAHAKSLAAVAREHAHRAFDPRIGRRGGERIFRYSL